MSIQSLPAEPSVLGESPVWHPREQMLYGCDIAGHRLNRYDPATKDHRCRAFDTDAVCCAPPATARETRPADELAAMPLSGCVLVLRVDVPGLPANFAR